MTRREAIEMTSINAKEKQAIYHIEFTDSGETFEDAGSFREAMSLVEGYEAEDKADGIYEAGAYTISRYEGDARERVYDSLHGMFVDIQEAA